MRGKKLLAAFLLGVGLCFVPVLGYGKINKRPLELQVSYMRVFLLESMVLYIMRNPTSFLYVSFTYDEGGATGKSLEDLNLAKGIDTKEKIVIEISDTRGVFSGKSRAALLNEFKSRLEKIYVFVRAIAWDMDTDIVAKLWSKEGDFLGYFYQGEYYLWEK